MQTFHHGQYHHDDHPSSRHNMPPKACKPPIYQKHKQFNRVIDLEDIEDPEDVSSFRPPPRFTTVRTPKAPAPAPTQPQPHKPSPAVSESKPAKISRFLDEIDPDLVAASSELLKPVVKKKRNTPTIGSARSRPSSLVAGIHDSTPTSYQQPQFQTSPLSTGRAVETPQHQNALDLEPLLGISASPNAGAEVAVPGPRPWKPTLPASSAQDRSARRSRFQDELDPDLLALVTTSKKKTRIDPNAPLGPVLAASGDSFDSPRRRMPMQNVDSHVSRLTPAQEPKPLGLQRTASSLATISRPQDIPDLVASSSTNRNPAPNDILSDRTNGELSRPLVRTLGELQHDESRAVIVQSHSASFNKRPRARSSSSLDFVPDTPRPKRQQQEDQRQVDADTLILRSPIDDTGSGTITVIPQSEDEIEDPESPSKLAQLSNPPQKRQIPEIDSSPTALMKLRKRQRTSVEGEDIIEDDPSLPLIRVRRHRVVSKRIYDASSSGDEIAENINVRDLNAKLEALAPTQLPPPSSIQTSGVPKPRQLMSLDAIRLRLTTKPAPVPQPALKPGMIHLLTHHKRLIIPRNPTPPPPSPPRRGYVEHGLAETAMWWKHDAKELTLRSVFTDDKPKLTFRILVREFLRDGDMCIVKGLGENQSGREGRVKAIVTDRITSAVTRAGLTLFYEKPWLPVTLFGEAEPYRVLIGRWDVRDVGIKKTKKTEKEGNTKKPGKEKPKTDQGRAKENIRKAESAEMTMDTGR